MPFVKRCVSNLTVSYTSPWQRFGVPRCNYTGILNIWLDDTSDYLISEADSIFYNIFNEGNKDYIDVAGSKCVATKELAPVFNYAIKNQKIKITIMLARKHSMSFADFVHYHKANHIKLFSEVKSVQKYLRRYVVSHTIPSAADNPFFSDMYDGIVELWFDNIIQAILAFINPKYLLNVKADEKRFLELRKCDFMVSSFRNS